MSVETDGCSRVQKISNAETLIQLMSQSKLTVASTPNLTMALYLFLYLTLFVLARQEMRANVDLEFVLHLLALMGSLVPELTSEEVLAKMCRKKAKVTVRHTVRTLERLRSGAWSRGARSKVAAQGLDPPTSTTTPGGFLGLR